MRKITTLVVLFLLATCLSLEAYTVVLKNGKVMQGTLISETSETIIFEDNSGVRYSLKKSNLDTEKMNEANSAPPPEPPKMEEQPATGAENVKTPKPATKKTARVYTRDDLERLREKYGELTLGTPQQDLADYEDGKLKPEAYGRRMKETAERVSELVASLTILSQGTATAWEFAQNTGKDPKQAVATQLASENAKEINTNLASELRDLRSLQSGMANPPKGFEGAQQSITKLADALASYQQTITNFESLQNAASFRARTDEISSNISMAIAEVQAWQPPAPAPQTASQPEATAAPQSQPEDQPADSTEEDDQTPPL